MATAPAFTLAAAALGGVAAGNAGTMVAVAGTTTTTKAVQVVATRGRGLLACPGARVRAVCAAAGAAVAVVADSGDVAQDGGHQGVQRVAW